jgi:outer membrane protein
VIQAWAQLQAAKAQIDASVRQNDAAERALNGVRNEAAAGQRTTQDVLNAEQAFGKCAAKSDRCATRSIVASYSLLSAVGRLSAQTLSLPAPFYDPMVHYRAVRDSWIGLRAPSDR